MQIQSLRVKSYRSFKVNDAHCQQRRVSACADSNSSRTCVRKAAPKPPR